MNDWFEWNGVRCTEYGLRVVGQPDITRAKERMTSTTVPGRAGSLTLREGEDIYDAMTLSCQCILPDPSAERLEMLSAWLRGPGIVTFANRPDGFYEANVANQVTMSVIVRGNPCLKMQIQFSCQPFLYLTDGQTAVTYQNTGAAILLNNPGNIAAQPLIKVYGTGEAAIVCGGSVTYFTDIDTDTYGYIVVDSADKVAYTGSFDDPEEPLLLCGGRVSGSWPLIPAGESYLYLSENITSIEITPRWRCV